MCLILVSRSTLDRYFKNFLEYICLFAIEEFFALFIIFSVFVTYAIINYKHSSGLSLFLFGLNKDYLRVQAVLKTKTNVSAFFFLFQKSHFDLEGKIIK